MIFYDGFIVFIFESRYKNSATKIIHVQVDEYTSENGYTYYRESKEQGAGT